jgi:hypothetical protein
VPRFEPRPSVVQYQHAVLRTPSKARDTLKSRINTSAQPKKTGSQLFSPPSCIISKIGREAEDKKSFFENIIVRHTATRRTTPAHLGPMNPTNAIALPGHWKTNFGLKAEQSAVNLFGAQNI